MDAKSIQQLSKTVQNCAEFEPTAQMTRWFIKAVELQTTQVSKIADSLGLHRSTFYYWLNTPGFRKWWLDTIDSYFHTVYLQLVGIGLRMSEKDYRYWHDLLEHVTSRVNLPETSKPQSQIEVMAAAFFKGEIDRGIDKTPEETINGTQIDKTKP